MKVLGTTFNVYSRLETCCVTCLSGRVEVHTGKESVILNPNMQVVVNDKINVCNDAANTTATGWMQGKFVFVEAPFKEVIAEVEHRYNIALKPDYNQNLLRNVEKELFIFNWKVVSQTTGEPLEYAVVSIIDVDGRLIINALTNGLE